tara:strand:- start:313 stop:465 length:153 start_codon:yes stop_codon:yes gene_type:complete
MDIELDIDCNNCNATYTMIYDSNDLREEETAFHCAFCGILMEPYYDEEEI